MAESSFTVHEPLTVESSKKVILNISGTDTDIVTVYKYTNAIYAGSHAGIYCNSWYR